MKISKTILGVISVILITVTVVSLILVLGTGHAQPAAQQGGDVGITSALNPVPGVIFTGDYLRIGINNGGTFGVTNPAGGVADPGVGLQWAGDTPFTTPSTESLAWAWWGEGYNIAYKTQREGGSLVDHVAYYQPGYGWPPPVATNIVPVSATTIINDDQKAIRQVVVRTRDGILQLTFTFTFLKEYPKVILQTTVKNVGFSLLPVTDVVYKRLVDFDVCTAQTSNEWASTANAAFAWENNPGPTGYIPSTMVGPVQLTVAGYQEDVATSADSLPTYVDLNAWDDMTVRKPGQVLQSFVPITGDHAAGIYYDLTNLARLVDNQDVVYTVYQANFPPLGPTG